jgi:hypothetical protein
MRRGSFERWMFVVSTLQGSALFVKKGINTERIAAKWSKEEA